MRNLVEQTSRNPCSPLPLVYQDDFPRANRTELFVVIIRDLVLDHPLLLDEEDLHELTVV